MSQPQQAPNVVTNNTTSATTTMYRPGYLYFSFFVWISTTGGRFLAPFLQHEGHLSAAHIGLVLSMQEVVRMVVSSLGGTWADARERQRPGVGRVEVMACGIVLGGVACLLHALQHFVDNGGSFFASPLWHGGLQFVYALSSVLTVPVLDGVTIHFLEQHPDFTRQDYGKERLYGAVGWAIMHMIIAPLLDWIGFTVIYPLACLSTVGTLITLYQYVYWNGPTSGTGDGTGSWKKRSSDVGPSLRNEVEDDSETSNQAASSPRIPLGTILRLLVGSLYGFTFIIALLSLAQGQAVVDNLVFIFFEYLGSSYTVMGLTVLLTVSFEIPIFRMAPWLLERWGGGWLLLLACFAYITRAVGYSCIPQGHIWYVLGLEPLHGVTYACSQTASVDIAAKSMPRGRGYDATGQSLMYLARGFGSCIGLALGGKAMDTWGPRIMYRVSSAVALMGSSTFLFVLLFYGEPTERSRELVAQTEQDLETEETLEQAESPSAVELQEFARDG